MRQLLILIMLVGVGYLIYTQGLPKWEEHKAAKQSASEDATLSVDCVNIAQKTVESFSSEIGQFMNPPVDRDLWGSMFVRVSGEIGRADRACSCATEACDSASAALYDLRGLANDLDRFVRNSGNPVLDGASRLERINRLLVTARNSTY